MTDDLTPDQIDAARSVLNRKMGTPTATTIDERYLASLRTSDNPLLREVVAEIDAESTEDGLWPLLSYDQSEANSMRENVAELGRQVNWELGTLWHRLRYGTIKKGRLSILMEPKDLWVGIYFSEDRTYVCPLPMLVFRWDKR